MTLDAKQDGTSILTIDDEGQGFATEYRLGKGGGLGSKLIASLVRIEEGSVKIDRLVSHGRVIVTLSPEWRKAEHHA